VLTIILVEAITHPDTIRVTSLHLSLLALQSSGPSS